LPERDIKVFAKLMQNLSCVVPSVFGYCERSHKLIDHFCPNQWLHVWGWIQWRQKQDIRVRTTADPRFNRLAVSIEQLFVVGPHKGVQLLPSSG